MPAPGAEKGGQFKRHACNVEGKHYSGQRVLLIAIENGWDYDRRGVSGS